MKNYPEQETGIAVLVLKGSNIKAGALSEDPISGNSCLIPPQHFRAQADAVGGLPVVAVSPGFG
jgi:hypothetical protein